MDPDEKGVSHDGGDVQIADAINQDKKKMEIREGVLASGEEGTNKDKPKDSKKLKNVERSTTATCVII